MIAPGDGLAGLARAGLVVVAGGLGEVLLIITAVSAVPPPGGPLQTRPGPRCTPCTGGGPGGTEYSKLLKFN